MTSKLSRRAMLRATGGVALGAALAPSARTASAEDGEPLSVMTYNIWVGGTRREPLTQTAKVIEKAQADLVGLQEVAQSGPELARLTGLTFFNQSGGRGVLTRYPIVDEDPQGWGVRVKLPQRHAWLFNCHLNHQPYQPYQLAGIAYGDPANPLIDTAAEAIGEALRARGREVASLLMSVGRALRSSDWVFVTGDLNEPSCLDWTVEAAAAGLCHSPVKWPTTRSLLDAGLSDSFRDRYPDPVKQPGHTWTPLPAAKEVHDRIDFIFHAAGRGMTCRSAEIVGESADRAHVVVAPYPSDHRAVACRFA